MKKSIHLTSEGRALLEQELKELIAERPAISERIATARAFGDLSENEEYSAARSEQKVAETRISEIEDILKNSSVIRKAKAGVDAIIKLGSTVTVKVGNKESVYSLVGPVEADPLAGRISNESPLGKILLGLKVGETAELKTPKGTTKYKIVSVE